MTKSHLPPSSNRHVEATFDLAIPKRCEDLGGLGSQTSGSGCGRKGQIDQSVDEYMQMAARMLYDIIGEWQERHADDKSGNKQIKSERKSRRKV